MKYEDSILKLRASGKSYNEIVNILGCSKGTVSYHCGACRDANCAKGDMLLIDFIQLCKEVCENNGYKVKKSGNSESN
jgi:hypothetical protein